MEAYKPQTTERLISRVQTVGQAYAALGQAVIALAANDLRDEYHNAHKPGARYRISSLLHFFRSPLYQIYSGSTVDAEYILRKIQEECGCDERGVRK